MMFMFSISLLDKNNEELIKQVKVHSYDQDSTIIQEYVYYNMSK
jgi:hypothetical protein